MTRFFIDRPIFSWVISIVILLAGAVASFLLPVAQYPDITPPTVTVSASYPGANARVVADSVAAPIEQQVNGVDHMMYMSSQCTNDGNYTLTVTFELGTDPNMNQVLVQNRVSLAMSQLPTQVQIQGVNVKKKSPDLLLAVNLFSPGRIYDDLYLSNYATTRIKDELLRLPGVGDVTYLGHSEAERPGRRRPDRPAAGAPRPAAAADHEHPGPAGGRQTVRRHPRQERHGQHRCRLHAGGAHPRRRPGRAGRPAV
jgi:multidrug efflux pump